MWPISRSPEKAVLSRPNPSRRRFLQLAGLTGAALAASASGGAYALWRAAGGELPPVLSPYFDRAAWRWSPAAPARPVLIVTPPSANPFGAYLAEILAAEGLNSFYLTALDQISQQSLAEVPLVLLADGELTQEKIDLLVGYVRAGGCLIAMRPAARLAEALGFVRADGFTADGYVQIAANARWHRAMAAESLQFHGEADHYLQGQAEVVAWLTTAQTRSENPAVLWQRLGAGQAVIWAFDLARSVALTRQGNPAWVNQVRASEDGFVRAQDMFPGWIDVERLALPQADEQMRLLTRLIADMLSETMPMPRLWYFPGAATATLIATGDAHQNPASAVEDVLQRVEQRGGRMSIYYTPPSDNDLRRMVRRARGLMSAAPVIGGQLADTLPTPSQIAAWLRRGHEFGLHPYVEEGLEPGWQRYWEEFTGMGYGPVPPTARTHRVLWTGWVETARTQAAHGIRMNLDYYHYGPFLRKSDGVWAFGHLTGSGLAMRFVDEQGRVLDVFQQLTQLVDEQMMQMPWGTGGEAAVGGQFHVDSFAFGPDWSARFGRWLEGTLDCAVELGIPIYSAEEWLTFTEVRDAATFENIQAEGGTLRFQLRAPTIEDVELALMLPARWLSKSLTELRVDGQNMRLSTRVVAGLEYGWATIAASDHTVEAYYA
jgi:hypothetical protein